MKNKNQLPKLTKKLTFHKETLRVLTDQEAQCVKGGVGLVVIPGYDPDDPKYSSRLSGCCKPTTR